MWLFSSTHKTTAFSGGFKYNPTISRTFSTKNGSVESLKCFCRCGSNPKACQMRCTVDFDTRVSAAICRILQCVPPFGFVSSVWRTNCATRSSLIGRGRPGRNSSCNPATSYFRKRRRHLPTVALVSSNCRAICRFVLPEALSKIILARITNPAGRDRELAKPSSCSRCSGFKTKAAFGRPIAIGTPILHWRYLNSQQYYCHLFMGHYTSICDEIFSMASCVCRCREFGSVDGSLIVMSEWSNHSVVNRRVPIVSARRGYEISLLLGDAGSVTDNLLRPSPTPTLSSCTIAAERGLLPRRVKSRPCERNQTK